MALKLKGSTSGFVALDSPSVAGNNTLILPENNGSAHQILANDITAGVTTFTQITVSRNGDLTVPGTISIGGTLTYEDVTSVDSVGIVTARGLSIFGNTTGLQVASGISTFQALTGTTGTFSGQMQSASAVVTGGITATGGNIVMNDSSGSSANRIKLGTSQDLELYHNGTHSFINNSQGTLVLQSDALSITNEAGNSNRIISASTGNVSLCFSDSVKLKTTGSGVDVSGTLNVTGVTTIANTLTLTNDLFMLDGDQIELGTDNDLKIFHSGFTYFEAHNDTEIHINAYTGGTQENMAKFKPNGAVELYHNGTKMIETISTGTNIPDGKFAKFGDGNDMSMGHNTYNYITYTGADFLLTGDATNQIKLQPKSDEPALICKPNAEVELYYNALVQAETQDGGFRIRGKNYTCHQSGDMDSTVNMKVCFYQLIAASGSHTFQAGSTYSMGTVTIHGSRGTPANNATLATGKIFPIHVRAGATAGLGSQIGSDLGGASGGFSYSVAAASQGITVTNSSSTYAMKCFVTFDLTGFV